MSKDYEVKVTVDKNGVETASIIMKPKPNKLKKSNKETLKSSE